MATLAQRNVNPGNIRDTTTGDFKQFSSAGEGYAALLNDLEAKKTGNTRTGLGPQSTLVEFAEKYAPESDGNNPGQYAANLANFMGVRPDSRIGELETGKWAEAVSLAEDRQFAESQGITPQAARQEVPTAAYQTSAPLPEQPQEMPTIPSPDDGVLSRLGSDLSGRATQAAEALTGAATGQINPFRGLLRVGGAAAGGVGDIIGAGLSAITPDFIEKPLTDAVGGVVGAGLNTGVGKGLVSAYEGLDPELKKDLGAAGNIASLIPIGKGIGLAGKAAKGAVPAATRAIAKTGGLAGQAATKRLVAEAAEIVAPKETAKEIKNAIKTGRAKEGGMFSTGSIDPNARTIRAAEAAAGIVKKGNSGIKNADAVRTAIGQTAETLEKDLKSLDVVPIVQRGELDGLMDRALKEIGENPTMVGNAEKSAERILTKFKSFLPEGDITAFDLLSARKKLDRWIGDLEGGSKVFDPSYENAKTIALRSIRQGANDLVAVKAPTVAVKESLAKQSALYDALENIAAKATQEVSKTGLNRYLAAHPGQKEILKQAATVAGLGTVGGLVLND